ncbi:MULTISPECIES: DnaB-like helicase C-terminal domain-containing protein [unclassified Thioalkalivibrio]|uniref:DnaB-like helicase C-terminal domain-containing protein n=1 Tax=unclassified Thioalkalivibrio TaxID=2621013 RepID=UPI00035EFBDB|nr:MULTISPECIES: DnaB-like helicase C-terminal domain-containing protein [unclassified Thioalkalivibrio]
MSEWAQTHLPCPCGISSDAYSINDEGWGKCFSCGKNFKDGEDAPDPETAQKKPKDKTLIPFGEYRSLTKRGITEETCKKFGYFIGQHREKSVQVAPYRNKEGIIVGQKVRYPDKSFRTTGDFKGVALFGQHLWPTSGKILVITEGEIDCMSVSQVQGNKWPVVSIPNGAQGAVNAIKENLEWVMGFEKVVLMFDMDDPGREAAQKVAELLPPGQGHIAYLSEKDPNELLQQGRGKEIVSAIWDAKPYRPDGIVAIDEILEDIEKPIEWGLPWFLPKLTELTYGRRPGEVYTLGAGTGIGKTDFITQQISYDVMELKQSVGVIFLEAKPVETGKRIAGKIDGARYHVPDAGWSVDTLRETLKSLKGKVIFYDSWGDTDWDVVKLKIRYMVVSQGIKLIYLDHLTAMADTANEKESIEQIMKELAGLANELGCTIHLVSHLSTPEGKPHEEGGRVMIRHFKGSRSIGFWSYFMFGMERSQQDEDEEARSTTTLRVLKDRYTGQATGNVVMMGYDHETGRLYEKEMTNAESHGFEGSSDF